MLVLHIPARCEKVRVRPVGGVNTHPADTQGPGWGLCSTPCLKPPIPSLADRESNIEKYVKCVSRYKDGQGSPSHHGLRTVGSLQGQGLARLSSLCVGYPRKPRSGADSLWNVSDQGGDLSSRVKLAECEERQLEPRTAEGLLV